MTAAWASGIVDTIHYTRTGGDKTPLVLAHGFTDNGLCWTRTAQVLMADYDVIMPDARGHGLSPSPSQEYSAELHADDLADVIRGLDLGQPVVIGHSMGAMNATYLAARHPDVVSAVILVDPPWRVKSQMRPNDFRPNWRDSVAERQTMDDDTMNVAHQEEHPTWHRLDIETKTLAIHQFDLRTFELYQLSRRPWQDVLAEIKCPALLIYADDGIVTAEGAAEAERIAPTLESQMIKDSGHSIQREQFEPFIAVVQQYLKRQDPA